MDSPLYDESSKVHGRREERTMSATGGAKGVKPERFDLIPVEALQEVARVYGFGAKKYDAHNWRRGYEWSKSYAAMMRHANEFWAGEDMDEETGCLHLASVIFHAMALMVFLDEQPEYDDRYPSFPDDMLTRNQSVYDHGNVQKENLEAISEELKGRSNFRSAINDIYGEEVL